MSSLPSFDEGNEYIKPVTLRGVAPGSAPQCSAIVLQGSASRPQWLVPGKRPTRLGRRRRQALWRYRRASGVALEFSEHLRQRPTLVPFARLARVTNARRLPLNLLDALRAFDQSEVLREGLGDEFSTVYLKLKYEDSRHLTGWERETTLDC